MKKTINHYIFFLGVTLLLSACGESQNKAKQTTENEATKKMKAEKRAEVVSDSTTMADMQGTWIFQQKVPCKAYRQDAKDDLLIKMKLEIQGNDYKMFLISSNEGNNDRDFTEQDKTCEGQFKIDWHKGSATRKGFIFIYKGGGCFPLGGSDIGNNYLMYIPKDKCIQWQYDQNGCVAKGCMERIN